MQDHSPGFSGGAAMLSGLTDTPPAMLARPKGCDLCRNTGYSGREGVYEIIKFDLQIVDMVREGVSIAEIRQFMRKRGDYLISDHALEKVRNHSFALSDVYGKILLEESAVKAAPVKKTESVAPVLSIAGNAGDATKSILVVDDDEDFTDFDTAFSHAGRVQSHQRRRRH